MLFFSAVYSHRFTPSSLIRSLHLDMLIIQISMAKTILFLTFIALACSLHIQNLEHTLSTLINDHEVALHLPVVHGDAPDINTIRNNYLASLPQGPTVDGGKANDIRNFFGSPMGSVIFGYFNSLATQPNGQKGLNAYNLSEPNFRLWMAIKILAGADRDMYARSLASDRNLFTELVQKSSGNQ